MCFIAYIGLFLLLNHGSIEWIPWERLDIGCFIGIQLLLETDLEAGLEEVGLHLGGRLERVAINSSRFDFELFHVLLSSDCLVIER